VIKLNCIIVDDEYPAIEELKYFIQNFSSMKILGEFTDGIEALQFLDKNYVNAVFLDINMPKIDGIALGRIIDKFNKKINIVFITAYREYAAEAFEIEAFDYLLKPFSKERIISTLNRLEKSASEEPTVNRIALWEKNKMVVIDIKDVTYCEANERDTIVYTQKNKYIAKMSISKFYKKLPSDIFFKTHRSYIVNINEIIEIIPWFNSTYIVKVKGSDFEIPVSRNNINDFKHIMCI
jgi:two-component system LytT family response regulator